MVAQQPAAFGELLKRYRLSAGLTQEGLAERAGLSERAISHLERGARRAPQRATLQLLAEALGLSGEEHVVPAATVVRAARYASAVALADLAHAGLATHLTLAPLADA